MIYCIGSLASHLAYPNQINEIVSFLVNRAQFDRHVSKLTTSEQKYLMYILMGIAAVLKEESSSTTSRISFIQNGLDYQLLIPMLIYFDSNNIEVRLELFQLTNSIINYGRTNRVDPTFQDFCHALYSSLASYGSSTQNSPVDYAALGNLLCNLVSVHSIEEFGHCIPMIFYLQKKMSKLSDSQQRALHSSLIEFFLWSCKYLSLDSFGQYMNGLKSLKMERKEWCIDMGVKDDFITKLRSLSFKYLSSCLSTNFL